MEKTAGKQYLIFRISWALLMLGIIFDLSLLDNIPVFIFKINVQTSSIVSVLYILTFFSIIPVTKIRKHLAGFEIKLFLILTVMLITAFISSYFSDLRGFAVGTTIFRYTLFLICFFCTVFYCGYFESAAKYIIRSFIYFNLLVIISSFADYYFPSFNRILIDHFGHMEAFHSSLKINGVTYIRPSGFITDTNLTAFTLALSCLLLMLNQKLFNKYFTYTFYILAGYSFGMLASRSALIIVIASAVLFWIFKYSDRKQVVIFLVLFFLVQLLTPQTQARLSQFFNKAYIEEEIDVGRPIIWKAAIIAFKTKPVIGIGSGVFFKESDYFLAEAKGGPVNVPKERNPFGPDYKQEGGINPHSIFLVMLTEYGVIGLLIFLLLLIFYSRELIINKQYITIIIFAGLLFVSALSNYAPYYKYFLVLCIIIYVLGKYNMIIRNTSANEAR